MPEETNINSKNFKADIKTMEGFNQACMEQLETIQNSLFRIEGFLEQIATGKTPDKDESIKVNDVIAAVADGTKDIIEDIKDDGKRNYSNRGKKGK